MRAKDGALVGFFFNTGCEIQPPQRHRIFEANHLLAQANRAEYSQIQKKAQEMGIKSESEVAAWGARLLAEARNRGMTKPSDVGLAASMAEAVQLASSGKILSAEQIARLRLTANLLDMVNRDLAAHDVEANTGSTVKPDFLRDGVVTQVQHPEVTHRREVMSNDVMDLARLVLLKMRIDDPHLQRDVHIDTSSNPPTRTEAIRDPLAGRILFKLKIEGSFNPDNPDTFVIQKNSVINAELTTTLSPEELAYVFRGTTSTQQQVISNFLEIKKLPPALEAEYRNQEIKRKDDFLQQVLSLPVNLAKTEIPEGSRIGGVLQRGIGLADTQGQMQYIASYGHAACIGIVIHVPSSGEMPATLLVAHSDTVTDSQLQGLRLFLDGLPLDANPKITIVQGRSQNPALIKAITFLQEQGYEVSLTDGGTNFAVNIETGAIHPDIDGKELITKYITTGLDAKSYMDHFNLMDSTNYPRYGELDRPFILEFDERNYVKAQPSETLGLFIPEASLD
jgi:hypothetical protein